LGVLTKGNTQLLFYDTPGVVPPEDRKQTVRQIITASWNVVEHSDIVCFVVDGAKRLDENVTHIMRQLETNLEEVRKALKLDPQEESELNRAKKCVLVVNKIDLVKPKDKLLPVIAKLNEGGLFVETFLTSALKGARVDTLKDYLLEAALSREWQYSADAVTDASPLERAEEIIREKVYQRLNQEVPYIVRQHNVGWTELPDGSLRIDQYLIVPKITQKWMITGTKGRVIKAIASEATEDIQKIFNRKVYVNLQVQQKKHAHNYAPAE
jgi:GTP-binding protein Era